MGERIIARRGLARAVIAISLAGLVAGCAGDQAGPAPVYLKTGQAVGADAAPPPPRRQGQRVVVRPGQSLRGIAGAYHVSERSIIAANRLSPPYKLKSGASLLIPGGAGPSVQQAAVVPRAVSQAPLPVSAAAPPVTVVPAPIAAPPPPALAAAAPPAPVAAPRTPPPIRDIISLDDPAPPAPPPPKAIAFPDPRPTAPPGSAPAQAPGPSAAAEARGEDGRQATAMH